MTDSTLTSGQADAADADDGADGLLCPGCGYDLRATIGDTCSECGLTIDRAALRVSGFPWAHRRGIAGVWTYLLTVWLVTIDSRRLRFEAAKPQDLTQARWFRHVTALIVAASIIAYFAALVASWKGLGFVAIQPRQLAWGLPPYPWWVQDLAVPWCAAATLMPVLPVMYVLLAWHLTGTPQALFRRKADSPARRERAAAIGYYAIAPLAVLMPVVSAASIYWIKGAQAFSTPTEWFIRTTAWGVWALGAVSVAARVAQWATRLRHARLEASMLGTVHLLGRCTFGVVAYLGVVPWCLGFLWILIDSLR